MGNCSLTGRAKIAEVILSRQTFRLVNSGECVKSKYPPKKGSYNFAVPDECTLWKSKTRIPKDVPCGIVEESFQNMDNDKEYILSLDGKQVGQGLKEHGVGDVNFWGFEGPPSLQDTMRHLHNKSNESNNILTIADKVFDQEDKSSLDLEVVKELKFVLQTLSCHIKRLCEAKVHHEILHISFNKKVSKFPEQGSRYNLVFSVIDAFVAKADMVIKEIL